MAGGSNAWERPLSAMLHATGRDDATQWWYYADHWSISVPEGSAQTSNPAAQTLESGHGARSCTRRGAKKFLNDDEEQELWKLMLKTMKLVLEIAMEAMRYANDEDGSVIVEIELTLATRIWRAEARKNVTNPLAVPARLSGAAAGIVTVSSST